MFYIVGTRGYDTNYCRIPIIETNPPSIVPLTPPSYT